MSDERWVGHSRLVGIPFSPPLLAQIPFGQRPGEWWRLQNPLPDDAVYLWCYTAEDRRSIVFVFTHPSFPEVQVGQPIPLWDLVVQETVDV